MRVFALSLTLGLLTVACGDDGSDETNPGSAGTDSASTTAGSADPSGDPTEDPSGDPTGDPSGDPTGDPTGAPGTCGDGKTDPGEECDSGAANSDMGACTSTCKYAKCGDGLLYEILEMCDDGNDDETDMCSECFYAECGDGKLGPGEFCDDGNDIDDDDCNNNCGSVTCGNGQVDGSEECDDGNDDDSDACLSSCLAAVCGDAKVHVGVEECDDGNQIDNDKCSNACKPGDDTPACNDNQKNGDETDLDCGGSCSPCGDGKVCVDNDDCASDQCSGGICEAGGGVKLEPVNCAPAMVGVDAAFAGAIMGNCGCHGGGQGGLTFSDAASFKAATVNVKATKADMNRITPGNIDESYILYKLHGQQAAAPGGGGGSMPQGGAQLADDKLCLMINWVKSIK